MKAGGDERRRRARGCRGSAGPIRRALAVGIPLALAALPAARAAPEGPRFQEAQAVAPPHTAHIVVTWSIAGAPEGAEVIVLRKDPRHPALAEVGRAPARGAEAEEGAQPAAGIFRDRDVRRCVRYAYRLRLAAGPGVEADAGSAQLPSAFRWEKLWTGIVLAVFCGWFAFFLLRGRRGKALFLRRIAGIDAMEEAIGRATEMGRPVLYVPGIDDQTEIQTLASLVVLRHVARLTAEYDTRIIVPNRFPVVLTMAEEVVREAHSLAGRPDTYRPDDLRFLSDEQFAFCAGVDGIMLRERPAANVYLGAFYAESLILAETGFASGAIQVAGTASVHQIPFFLTACDYTIIGEEFYAMSAYLGRDPRALASIKAGDFFKVFLIAVFLAGVGLRTLEEIVPDRVTLPRRALQVLQHPERIFLDKETP